MTSDAGSRQGWVARTHIDGLDGLRGLAIAGVVLYLGKVGSVSGGFLGAELFFVLSGFLITAGLLREWLGTGTVALVRFWAGRARRVLPALFVVVGVVGLYYAIRGTFSAVPGLFGDGLASLFGYANWHQFASGTGGLLRAAPASPLHQLWSLAIEEQFYAVWPLLLVGVAGLILRGNTEPAVAPSAERARHGLDALLGLALVLLVASAVDMVLLFHHGGGQRRVYFGSDTRAFGLMAGAALAIVLARLRLPGGRLGDAIPPTSRASVLLAGVLSCLILAALCLLMLRVRGDQLRWLYPWGLLLTDALTAALIAIIVLVPRAAGGRLLGLAPVRWLGQISYGVFLWYLPLSLWIAQSGWLAGRKLTVLRIVAALIAAALSYLLVERPIRERRWPTWLLVPLAPLTAAAAVLTISVAAATGSITIRPPAKITVNLRGTGHCVLQLANTQLTGEVPPPMPELEAFQNTQLGNTKARWPIVHQSVVFHTCDPTPRALVIGDSIAFTIATPMLYTETNYGMALDNAAILGCSFAIRGELDENGKWKPTPTQCPDSLTTWSRDATSFGADEVIFELGYRDEFNWKWNGRIVHLGEPAFDRYVEGRIARFIRVLGENGKRKLLFLSIPFVEPKTFPDGQVAPETYLNRHAEINQIIRRAAAADHGDAEVLDIDQYLAPNGRYSTDVNDRLCRADGIHVTPYCSGLLERPIFRAARELLKH